MERFTFVIAEMAMPVSMDPLEADYSNNLHASQMVHKSLLEVADDNTLQSSLLKSFGYDPAKRQIHFTLDQGAKFSDDSSVTIEDIEISLKRMMLKRPTFPVLRHIVGIKDWARMPNALNKPVSGIRIQGDTLFIQLEQDVKNPLYRFALPIYGVVKKDCVDAATNKVRPGCPVSGFYSLARTEGNNLTFVRNKNVGGARHELPESITLAYHHGPMKESDYLALGKGTYVAFTEESPLESSNQPMQTKLGFTRFEQPNARFSVFQLNPKSPAFMDVKCRQRFAAVLREELSNTFNHSPIEASIFNRIVPGYMTSDELAKTVTLTESDIERCQNIFKGRELRWMPQASSGSNSAVEAALKASASRLSLKLQTLPEETRQQRFDDFVNNKLDVLMAGSGFWAFDPVGDIQMLFTSGLHKPLVYLSEDDHLQSLLNGLEFEQDPTPRLKKINEYLYQQSLFNVFTHSKRVYVAKGMGVSRSIPVAITPPAPWQVFSYAAP